MATWKKVVVSGSNISELVNDSNYLSTQGGGILSGSAEGDAQGQIKLNGVNIDANALGTTDSPTFAGVTATLTGNVTGSVLGNVTGDLTGDVTGDVTGDLTGDVTGSVLGNVTGDLTGDVTGNVTGDLTGSVLGDVIGDLTGTADTASYVAFTGVDGLTAFSASVASDLVDTAFNVSVGADSGTDDVIADGDTLNFEGGDNVTTTVSNNNIKVDLDANISLTSVTASVQGNVVGNVTGDVTGTADTASYVAASTSGQGKVSVGTVANIGLGVQASDSPTFASLTLTGDLIVQGDTTTLNTANLNVEDQFILINSGGSAADAGIVTEAGESFGWDQSEGRWAFDFTGGTFNQTTIGADAYAAAVVTTDDANYQKNGNIYIDGSGDINIYVE